MAASRVLGKGVEEVTQDVRVYIDTLRDIEPKAREEASQKPVKECTDCTRVSSAEAMRMQPPVMVETARPPPTRSGWTELDRKIAALMTRQENLVTAINAG